VATPRIRRLARLAVLAATGRTADLEGEIRAAAKARVPLRAVRETFLQVCLFAGFPRTVNALDAFERALGRRPPDRPERLPAGERGRRLLERRGRALFGRVYGPDAGVVLEVLGRRHPEFRDCVLVDAYGKVMGRRGLSAAERECLAVALLAALDLPRQQVPHVRGALRCGARPAGVSAALDAVADLAPEEAVRFARERLAAEASRARRSKRRIDGGR
jgi:alkylhydroperoxidase/carboxymuconolactone decarboxylase family protein YurZ